MSGLFRFNVVDEQGTASFTGPAHGLKAIAAACATNPANLETLLNGSERYDPQWVTDVRMGLRVFDEQNVDRVSGKVVALLQSKTDAEIPPFRVLDTETRTRSMQPSQLGLIVINLKERRIIQIQNIYAGLQRKGRGRIRVNGRPTRTLFHYDLPTGWSIVP